MKENMFSVQFYDYNTRNYSFKRLLKEGDVIEAIEFNTDTQLWDVKVKYV
jgi:hypothetical protein